MKFKKIILWTFITGIILAGCSKGKDKAIALYKAEDVNLNIEQAFDYFDSHVNSATIHSTTKAEGKLEKIPAYDLGNEEETISFEKANTDDFTIRVDAALAALDGVSSTYQNPGGYYINIENVNDEYEISKKLHKEIGSMDLYETSRYDIKQYAYFKENEDMYSDATKEQVTNEDGSIDIFLRVNTERLNKIAKENYDELFTEEYVDSLEAEYSSSPDKDQLLQDALAKRGEYITYYPGEYDTKIHIGSEGFINEISESIKKNTYLDFINGGNIPYTLTHTCTITNINTTEVKTDDIELVSYQKLKGKDNFTTTLTPEETMAMKDGDIITKLPDLPTLVNKDLYYTLNQITGEVRLFPLHVAYLSEDDGWDIEDPSNSNTIHYQDTTNKKVKALISILEAMPSFQDAKAKNTSDSRIEYVGNKEWTNE